MRTQFVQLPFIIPLTPSVRAMCTRPCKFHRFMYFYFLATPQKHGYKADGNETIAAGSPKLAHLPHTPVYSLIALNLHQDF